MRDHFSGMDFVRAYIDGLLIISSETFEYHLDKLGQTLSRLQQVGLKVNPTMSSFAREELKYRGHWITQDRITSPSKKIKAINNLASPQTRKHPRGFIGMVNCYRDMWIRRSETLTPLTALASKIVKFKSTDVEQNPFNTMKRIMARETLLAYPNFNKEFHIHTDASKVQIGAVISQEGRPIAFFCAKLTPAQTRYTTTESKLLSIVEVQRIQENTPDTQDCGTYR